MTGDMGRDPLFREQYAGGVLPDPEVEAALGGPNTPRMYMPPVTQPLGAVEWLNHGAVKLR